MKKTIFTILICGVMVLGITGCGNKAPLKTGKEEIHTFHATITECEQNSMIVRPEENEEEYRFSDKFRIDFVEDFSACSVNDKVKISYVGNINESYPTQIDTTKIEISKNSETIPNYTKTIDNSIIEMNIPNEWYFEELSIEENYKFALKVYKKENDDYFILYYLNAPFGVCGTGRNVQELKLDNGKSAMIGYYDASKTWSDISFHDDNPNIALENYGTEDNDVFSFIKTINIKRID